MVIYRAMLVWLLRGGALATFVFAVLRWLEMRTHDANAPIPEDLVGSPSPSEYWAPVIAIAVVGLALAETLSLLNKRA
jgi:hypothetical protein